MDDDLFYLRPQPPRRLSPGQPGDLYCEFLVGHDRYLIELRDPSEQLGVETVVLKNEELLIKRRFDPRLDASRPSRELAIAWAEEERTSIERGGA